MENMKKVMADTSDLLGLIKRRLHGIELVIVSALTGETKDNEIRIILELLIGNLSETIENIEGCEEILDKEAITELE